MKKHFTSLAIVALALTSVSAQAADKGSSGHQIQEKGEMRIPHCTRKLGTVAIVEPDKQWWREYNLGSPEAILKIFVSQSGCFGLVNRDRSLQSRAMERALADNGELQSGSNVGRGQVKTADYFLQPDIVTANRNSGGGGFGAALGGLGGLGGGMFGHAAAALAGGINVKKGEASVTLSIVNARTTEEMALVKGYARKSDVSFGGGGGVLSGGSFGGAAGGGYQDTAVGQIIVLAYLDAYTKLVTQLGGLPSDASAAAPQAK